MADLVKFNSTSEEKYNSLEEKENGTFYKTDKHIYLDGKQLDNVKASATESGTVQLGYISPDVSSYFAVRIDVNGNAYVNVPAYKAGRGLTLKDNVFTVNMTDSITSIDANQVLSASAGNALKDLIDGKLPLTGGTVNGDLWVGSNPEGARNLGIKYAGGSLIRQIYLYGNGLNNERGLRDSIMGDLIDVTDTTVTFRGSLEGNAATATIADGVRDVASSTPVTFNYGGQITTTKWVAAFEGDTKVIRAISPENLRVTMSAAAASHTHIDKLSLTGGTLSGSLWVSASNESDVGVIYSGGSLYLYGYGNKSSRGLYDSKKGDIIVVSDSAATFYGNASTASSATTAGNVTGIVAIANGGTAASNAATARTNLGITLANLGAAAASHGHTDLQNQINTLNSNKCNAIQIYHVEARVQSKTVITDTGLKIEIPSTNAFIFWKGILNYSLSYPTEVIVVNRLDNPGVFNFSRAWSEKSTASLITTGFTRLQSKETLYLLGSWISEAKNFCSLDVWVINV